MSMTGFASIAGGLESYGPVVSADGGTIIFTSKDALDASVTDVGSDADVFIYDVASGRISNITAAASNNLPFVGSGAGGLSADGRLIVFSSTATNLDPTIVDSNGKEDVFIYDRLTGTTKNITSSLPEGGFASTISEDGKTVAFLSFNGELRIYDLESGTTHVAATSANTASNISLSGDGRFLVFASGFPNHVDVYDAETGQTETISDGISNDPQFSAFDPLISADGSTVAFAVASLGTGGPVSPDAKFGVFVYKMDTGALTHVMSHEAGTFGTRLKDISSDGTQITFYSSAAALGGSGDIFVYDATADQLSNVTETLTGQSLDASLADNGLLVVRNSAGILIERLPYHSSGFQYLTDDVEVVASTYQFFSGKIPSASGFEYLISSPNNPNDLNDSYYDQFNRENRFINFASNLGTEGLGAAAFEAKFGALSFEQTIKAAYLEIMGTELDGGALEFFLNGQGFYQELAQARVVRSDVDLAEATKIVAIGSILNEAVKSGVGRYAQEVEGLIADLQDDGKSSLLGHDLFAVA
jgi:Tol biopolymer transport system component